MVQTGICLSLAPVGVWTVDERGSEGPRVQSDGGSFLSEEDVVQVWEDGSETS
jgi:hypothetical protein